jgi:hypothetical protein
MKHVENNSNMVARFWMLSRFQAVDSCRGHFAQHYQGTEVLQDLI